jgi:toxin YoeB
LIEECLRDPFQGLGNPEPLKHELAGYWSRRITKAHRLVYQVVGGRCVIIQCRYHY